MAPKCLLRPLTATGGMAPWPRMTYRYSIHPKTRSRSRSPTPVIGRRNDRRSGSASRRHFRSARAGAGHRRLDAATAVGALRHDTTSHVESLQHSRLGHSCRTCHGEPGRRVIRASEAAARAAGVSPATYVPISARRRRAFPVGARGSRRRCARCSLPSPVPRCGLCGARTFAPGFRRPTRSLFGVHPVGLSAPEKGGLSTGNGRVLARRAR